MAIDRRATRLGLLGLVGVILFSLLGVRLWFLQTVRADELQERADISSTRLVRIPPERGRIFDSEGRVLAGNKRVLTVAVDYQLLRRQTQRTEIFTRLSGWVQVPVEDLEARYDLLADSPFLPFPIKRGIDEPTAIAILERVEDFPGVKVLTEWERVYPYAPHASHIIGYMGAITEAQVDDRQAEGYLLSERVGQFGVERYFERELHGEWGYQRIEVDAAERPIRVIEDVPPINGLDIQLTIDLEQQQFVEQQLETTLKARRTVTVLNPNTYKDAIDRVERLDITSPERVAYKAPAGAALIMNYQTGEVAAMASYPSFDNRWFEAGLSKTKFQEIFPSKNPDGTDIDPDQSILVNRAIQGRYNLGSTFKAFTAFSALSTGLIDRNEIFNDTGTYELHSVQADRCNSGLVRCIYKNATCPNGRPCVYGAVTVEDALAVSSDAFFYRIGEDIFVNNDFQPVLQEQVEQFSFGADTGIELPFEFDGTVPDAALKREYADLGIISDDEGRSYYVGDNVQLSIGQGLLSATPLQLATGYGTLANGGLVLQPTILKAIWNPGVPDGEPGYADFTRGTLHTEESGPIIVRTIPMTAEIRDPIVQGLRRVITGPGANGRSTTGEEVFDDYPAEAIQIAGKTGTAQGANNYPWNDSSVFAAFSVDGQDATTPDLENPYVVVSFLEKAGYGSQASAPLTKCTFLMLSGAIVPDPIAPSAPLDLNQTVAAPSQSELDVNQPHGPDGCWTHEFLPSSVLTDERSVE
ncbi:MAG TPA: penicillin-binding transpeptidase domain-containing protein [Ilumatobacter sp.]|nr:penicillin-binding transpeptidase domain-containing protein [Ilumatobacter sp.]